MNNIDNIIKELYIDNIDKIIKRIDIGEYTYLLGYDEWEKRIFSKIGIYKDNKLLATGELDYGESFYFDADVLFPNSTANGNVDNIKEMFNKLRQSNNIPEEVEREFEGIYLMYKLNDFNIE